jgi:hypothetical protein
MQTKHSEELVVSHCLDMNRKLSSVCMPFVLTENGQETNNWPYVPSI